MHKKSLNFKEATEKLENFRREYQRPPSFEEIRQLFRYKSKNAAFWLIDQLIKAGLAKKDRKGKLLLSSPGIRWLGTVPAGSPVPAQEENIDTLQLDSYLVKNPAKSFVLRVTGDSMIGAGINAGDLVVVERDKTPKNGDIVVAHIDGEWTLKYFEKKGRQVRLVAANKKYPIIRPLTELTVGGIVVASLRRY